MPWDPNRLQAIFLLAIEANDAAARAQVLERECGGDAELRQRVEALLAAHDAFGGFLDRPPVSPFSTLDIPRPSEGPGVRIGPYKLLQQIGEGGMGVVFLAEQLEPVQRKVALKLIKPGMDTQQVVARFEAERQALALMDHPNIAKVLDAGATDSGRPYFVMELVKGLPITKYCDQEHLTPQERLQLFVPICQAVQHAHQKGIIHRDLKPSNILIALYDGRPVPKVIDFGVAKATGAKLTERTLFTEVGHAIGTWEYMAPEQAELNNLDIDTRADIYALGATLYELLAGSPPFTRGQLRNAAFEEMLRMIREVEPPKPSTRLSSSDELPSLAAKRKLEPAKLSRMVRGDLDWIVMKCLEKERGRRYETANGLARDLQRYLADEVVEARPPSALYRLRKFVRRHKGQVLAGALVLFLLLIGIAGTTAGLIHAEQQRQLAEKAADLASDRLEQVQAEKKIVEIEKQKGEEERLMAQAVRDFLQKKLLGQADTEAQADALLRFGGSATQAKFNPTIRELLDRAALELAPDRIEGNFPGQALLQAELLKTLGDTYLGLGEYGQAIQFLARSANLRKTRLGSAHPATLASLHNLAQAYKISGDPTRAIELYEQVRDAKLRQLGAEHPETLTTLTNLASAYRAAGKLPQAIDLYEQVSKAQARILGADHRETLITQNNLAGAYLADKKVSQAIALYEQVWHAKVNTQGADHPSTISTLINLALAYKTAGKLPQAIEFYEQVRDANVKQLEKDHPRTLSTLNNLASAYQAAGNLPQAIGLYEEVWRAQAKKLGADHPSTLITLNNLASAYQAAGKKPQALEFYEQAATGVEKGRFLQQYAGRIVPNTFRAYEEAGQWEKAEAWRRKWTDVVKERAGDESADYASELASLGRNLLQQKKYSAAESTLRECLERRERLVANKQGGPWQLASTQSMLGAALASQQKFAAAEPLLLRGYQGLKDHETQIPAAAKYNLTDARERLVRLYEAWGKPDEAAKWRK